MRRLGSALIGLLLLAACAEDPASVGGSGASPKPGTGASPVPSSSVTISNLSGDWVFGSRTEPSPGPVATCVPGQVMSLSDSTGDVTGGVSVCAGPCHKVEALVGTNAKGRVILRGTFSGNLGDKPTDVDYDLTYNPATQHLVGTRAGVAFWAAPLVTPTSCENVVL